MKTNLAAGTFLSVLFWSLLSVSLFAAPLMVAERGGDPSAQVRDDVQDLIRMHQQATSALPQLPAKAAQSGGCEAPADTTASEEADATMSEAGAAEPDAPMIRPVGKRAERIQV